MSGLEVKKMKKSQVILMVIEGIIGCDFSEAEKASKEVLSLPIYSEIEKEKISFVRRTNKKSL